MDTIIQALIEDLRAVQAYAYANPDTETPEIVVAYLATNGELLEFLLDQTYIQHPASKREDLARTHRELNEMSASDQHLSSAKAPIAWARQYWIAYPRNLAADNIHQLLRGVEYAKYLANTGGRCRLLLSPIQRYLHE